MNKTEIEYLDYSWNPLAMRCKPVSAGCKHCWHLRMCNRLAKNPRITSELQAVYAGNSKPVLVENRLMEPLKHKRPALIGVQFMGDLFHEDVKKRDIDYIFSIIEQSPQHKFLVLTKRLDRAIQFVKWVQEIDDCVNCFSNVWWGTSIENQKTANERVPKLLEIPGNRWLSIEPLLDEVSLNRHWLGACDWVTCGAETGQNARHFENRWAAHLLEQCAVAGVPFFMKKVAGGEEPPPELLIREYPL